MGRSNRQRKLERPKYSLGIVFCFISLLYATYAAATISLPVFGPKRYDRLKGAPTVYTDTFERCKPAYSAILRITNGDSQATRIKSASIVVNGVEVASENDFKQQAPYFEKNVAVADINQLVVALKSGMQDDPSAKNLKDQSFLIIEIAGTGCDDTPPVLSNLSPADGSLINAASPLVSARFADNADGSGIDPASARMNVDDRDVTLSATASQAGISYQPDRLPEGGHTVSAGVADKAGNAASLSWKFTTDTVPPAVAVTSHRNNQYVSTGMITLSGTVQDPAPAQPAFTTGPVIVTVNGAAAEVYGNEFVLAGLSLFEGPNSVQVEALDAAGNKASAGIILNLDTVAPVLSITSPPDNVFLNTPVINLSGTVSEELTTVKINGNPAIVSGTGFSSARLALSEGVNVLLIEAFDRAGNRGTKTVSVNLDTVPPTAAISGAPASPINATAASFIITGPDVVAYRYAIDSGAFQTETATSVPILLTGLADGNHSLDVIGKDIAGNWQPETSATTVTWIVDRTAPSLNVSALPDGAFTNNSVLNISGTVTDNVGVQGATINDAPVAINADGSFSQAVMLTAGANIILTRATDKAGNRAMDARTVTLDQNAPTLVITAPTDNSVTNEAGVNVTGTVDEAATVTVKMNNEDPAPAAIHNNTFSLTLPLSYNLNTIEVTATDRAGNSTTDKRSVTYDNVKPSLAITNPAQDITTNQPAITLEGTVTDITAPTVTVTHDGTTYTPVATNGIFRQALAFAAEKTYTVMVTAADAAGNATTIQRNIIYDITPPAVGIDPVVSPTNQVNQTIRGTREERATVSVMCPSASIGHVSYPTSVTWQAALTNMTEGSNQVSVTASDTAGNRSNPEAASIMLDTIAPGTTIGSGPAVITNVNTAVFSFTSTEPGSTFECKLDNGAFSTCVSPVSYASLVDGSHAFMVKATDASSNADPAPAAYTWAVDTVAPAVQITAPQAEAYLNTPTITVTGTTTELVASVIVNGAPAVVAGTSFSFPNLGLAEGVNTVSVVATDVAGNAGAMTINVTLDTIPPVIQVTAPQINATLNTPLITVSGNIVEANPAGLWINNNPVQLTGQNFNQANVALTEGQTTISLRATDRAGHETTIYVPITLDTIPPAVTITTPVDGARVRTQTVTVSGRVSEQNTTVTVNNVPAQVTGQDFTLAGVSLIEGPNNIIVRAFDRAGNNGTAPTNITLDSTAPSAPVITQLPSPSPTPIVTVNGTAEAGSTVTLSMQAGQGTASVIGTATASAQGTFSIANITLAEGTSMFTAIAADSAGNTSPPSAPVSVMRDTTPPVITISSPANNSFANQSTITVIGSLSEPGTLTTDGSPVTLDGLNFSHSVSLTSATNFIVISARDLSNNAATLNWVVYLDQTLPVVTLSAPAAGFLTMIPQVAVSGSVNETPTSVIVNGVPATITNKNFTFANAALAEGQNLLTVAATDRAGNIGTATVNVVLDTQVPVVTITAPAQAAAGSNITISCGTSDNIGLMNIDALANGAPVWSTTLNSKLSTLNSFAYSLSPDLAANTVLTFQARATDTAGNIGTATANVQVIGGATGPGYIQGEVYDDSKGQLLAGATADIFTTDGQGSTPITTVEDGSYFIETPAGDHLVVLNKKGFTTVERMVTIKSEKDALAIDARLTPVSTTQNLIDSAGGTIKAGSSGQGQGSGASNSESGTSNVELIIPANALDQQIDIRLTPISSQGLAGILPAGWSPIAVIDVTAFTSNSELRPLNFNPASTLRAAVVSGLTLTAASSVALVSYATNSHQWIVQEPGTVSTDGAFIAANIASTGQYAFVLPDQQTASLNFALGVCPACGMPLREIVSSTVVSGVTATGRVMPAVAPAAVGLKAVGEITISSPTSTVNSGSIISAKVTERFDLLSGEVVLPSDYTQDLVLYKYPCLTNLTALPGSYAPSASSAVKTVFPITPTHEYTIVDLMTGKIHLEIYSRDSNTASGTMVGTEGARLLDKDGNVLSIPQGALTNTIPVETKTIPASTLTGVVGNDFTLLRAVDVNFTEKTLSASAELSIPAPVGVSASLPIVVAKAIEIKGVKKLKLVALAKISGSLVTSFAAFAPLREINTSGLYVFLQSKAPLGIVSGIVTDGATKAYPSAQVTSNTCSLVDLTSPDGKYLVASAVANFSVTGTDIYKNDKGTRIDTITTANETKTLNITINVTPPYVISVSPADAALGVEPKTQIAITMSEAVKPESVTSNTVILEDATGTRAQGLFSLSPDGTVITLYPENNLKSETRYTLTVTHSIQDMQGYFMGQDYVSHFTIKDTTPPPMPAAGSIVASFPDADGYITITATQGSAEATGAVLIINDTSGEIATVAPASNGSFTGRIMGQLGDEIKIVSMDSSGNQTLITYITFKSDDGRYLVTAKGGTIEGVGGLKLEIPEGALTGPAVIKITPVLEGELPQDNPVPPGGKYLAAVHIDTSGATFLKEVKLSVPAPSNIPADAVPFVARPIDLLSGEGVIEKVYEIVNSVKVVSGRLTTASPPFDGILVGGTYVFAYPEVHPVILDGYLYRDRDGIKGYDPQADIPISAAIVRSPDAMNYVARTNSNGHYATYSWAISSTGTSRDYKIIATDIYTQETQNSSSTLYEPPYTARLDFAFASFVSAVNDRIPPSINVELGPPDAFTSGITPVGTNVAITVRVSDNLGVDRGRTTIAIKQPDSTTVNIPLSVQGVTAEQVNDTLREVVIYGGSCQPLNSGPYTLTTTAFDRAAVPNMGSRSVTFSATREGEIPAGVPGPPRVNDGGVYPTNEEKGVMVTTQISVQFTEPVQNVDTSTFTVTAVASLISDPTFSARPVAGQVSAYYVGGSMRATFTPLQNLRYATRYRVKLSSAIVDADEGNALAEFVSQFETKVPDSYDLTEGVFTGRDIAVLGDYAFVAAGENGWRVVSIVDPEEPTIKYSENYTVAGNRWEYRGVTATDGVTSAVSSFITGPLAALTENISFTDGNQYSSVRFYDISSPAAPKAVGHYKLGQNFDGIPGRLAILDKYAYICSAGLGLQVVDIEAAMNQHDPDDPVFGTLDTMDNYRSPADIAVLKGNLLLTTTAGFLLAVSVDYQNSASPQLPVVIGEIAPYGDFYASRVAVAGGFSYMDAIGVGQTMDVAVVTARTGAIFIVNVTDPSHPTIVSSLAGINATDVNVDPSTGVIYASTWNGLTVIDIKSLTSPRVIVTLGGMGSNPAIYGKNGWIFMANQNDGIKVVDLGRQAYLIPDYDHNGVINDSDGSRAGAGGAYYFWINDDNDSGETGGDDIPMEAGQQYNAKNNVVDGVRDLIDFFPVHLDIKSLLVTYDPSEYIYKLKSPGQNMNFVLTDMTREHSSYYLTGDETSLKPAIDTGVPANSLGTATVYPLTSSGVVLNDHPGGTAFLQRIKDHSTIGNTPGIILIEGSKAGKSPLVLEISDRNTNRMVLSTALTINLASVEKMFRHKNLIQVGGGPAPAHGTIGGEPDRLGELPDFPDEPNAKNFVFVHGYNVNGNQARGWQSEMFKRMYWAGSKAKFWAVSWYGFESQTLGVTLNFHANVKNAFDTAEYLRSFLISSVKGDISISAHSLGNMVVSEMLVHRRNEWSTFIASPDNNVPKVNNYFLINAAVAEEAYDGGASQQLDMVNIDWDGYKSELRASEWHTLFAENAGDTRGKLTWRDRFVSRPTTTYYNFYSQGDQVLEPHPYNGGTFSGVMAMAKETGKYAWALSEKLKGGLPFDWMLGSGYGGWRFNIPAYPRNAIFPNLIMIADDANKLDSTGLLTKPFFQFAEDDATTLLNPDTGSQFAMLNRDRLISEAIPALTLPAGRVRATAFPSDNNFEMQTVFKTKTNNCDAGGCWPAERVPASWKHSDIREVAYLYTGKLFKTIINLGGLNQ